jgi:Ni/Fe-hydrogenase subunit HybB-like protein
MVVSASAGLVVYALTVSLAGVDWLESLTPEFHSSIFGLLFLTFVILAGFAFALTIALLPSSAPTFRYGAILLSALLLWAYNHAMQYIIIWSGNIPEEVVWYLRRESDGWGVVLWALVTLQFILPFFAMLSDRARNDRRSLLTIAAMTLALRFMESFLLTLPGTGASGAVLWLAIPATIVLCGAVWWAAFRLVFDHVRLSALDLRPLAGAFDPSGSPMPPGNSPSGGAT